MREIRMLRAMRRGAGNGDMVRTEAPALGESRRQQLLPLPLSTAPAPDPTEFASFRMPAGERSPFFSHGLTVPGVPENLFTRMICSAILGSTGRD